MLVASRLQADHRPRPLGCSSLQPKLSWNVDTLASGMRGAKQTAYRILAAESPATLAQDLGDLWDTNKVLSRQSFGVEYLGKQPARGSVARVYWKVALWDEQGDHGPWSPIEYWLTSLVSPTSDWQAHWISAPASSPAANAQHGSKAAEGSTPSTATTAAAAAAAATTTAAAAATEAETAAAAAANPTATGTAPSTTTHVASTSTGAAAAAAAAAGGSAAEGLAAEGEAGGGTAAAEPGPAPLVLPPPQHFLTSFEIKAAPKQATLCCTAKGIYRMYLNGEAVAADYFTPGWTDYTIRHCYNLYDVTQRLRLGGNSLGAVVADGWYAGYIGWRLQREHYGSRVALLAQLVVDYEDGSREVLAATGAGGWRSSNGPLLEADFLMGEKYDARREVPGWSSPGFDSGSWSVVEAAPLGADSAKLEVHCGFPVQAVQEFVALDVSQPQPGVFVFNLGQNFAGFVRLKVVGSQPGDSVVLRFAERLQPSGMLYTENLRTARATDTYICKGDPVEEWQPDFTFHGFQYVEVTGYPGSAPPPLDTITGVALTSSTPRTGFLETSDPRTNQLLNNIWWTQRSNFIELPTDCPQRDERLGWTGDAQVYITTACYLTDAQAFYHKWLKDLRDAQAGCGQFPMFAPLPAKMIDILGSKYHLSDDGGPAWADAGALCPWALYEMYGDEDILRDSFASMLKFVDYSVSRCDESLVPPTEFHCFGDWLNVEDNTPKEVMFLSMLAASVAATRDAAEVLKEEQEHSRLALLWQRVKEAFISQCVQQEGYSIRGDSQCAYVVALAYDLLESGQKAGALKRLLELLESRQWHLSTGFISTRLLMLVLDIAGRNDVAYRLLHNTTYPSWGFSLGNGATSIWERWDGWTPEKGFQDPGMNSFAHYSFGAVGQWLMETVGGIRPTAPGFSSVAVRPQPGGELTWARCSYLSKSGLITSNWSLQDGRLTVEVGVPPNVAASICLPCPEPELVETDDETKNKLKPEQGSACCSVEVGSGLYSFSLPFQPTTMPAPSKA